jgi:hypothetical protein
MKFSTRTLRVFKHRLQLWTQGVVGVLQEEVGLHLREPHLGGREAGGTCNALFFITIIYFS